MNNPISLNTLLLPLVTIILHYNSVCNYSTIIFFLSFVLSFRTIVCFFTLIVTFRSEYEIEIRVQLSNFKSVVFPEPSLILVADQ